MTDRWRYLSVMKISSFYKWVLKTMIICYNVPETLCMTAVIVFFFWGGHFLPFYPRNSPKIMIICYTIPEIWHMTNVIVIFYFRVYLVLLFPNSPKNKKKWKHHLEISSLTPVPKIMIWWGTVPEISCTTDRWMEKVTYRGGCPT